MTQPQHIFPIPCGIVWFKRDLRLTDHPPIKLAVDSGLPVCLIYILEPSVLNAPDFDIRHMRFIWHSLNDIDANLRRMGQAPILRIVAEATEAFDFLKSHLAITSVWSHKETGTAITYRRDQKMASYFKEHQIKWMESTSDGVIRGLRRRDDWSKKWYEWVSQPLHTVDFSTLKRADMDISPIYDKRSPDHATNTFASDGLINPLNHDLPIVLSDINHISANNASFQPGGPSSARRYLKSFLLERGQNYRKHISKPEAARTSCARISPYLAWGNISVREAYQAMIKVNVDSTFKQDLSSFANRLRWRAHF